MPKPRGKAGPWQGYHTVKFGKGPSDETSVTWVKKGEVKKVQGVAREMSASEQNYTTEGAQEEKPQPAFVHLLRSVVFSPCGSNMGL